MFLPQRHPWNPGGTNFGVQYGYKLTVATNSDFWVWTYAYDVSGITNVSLLLRVNGTNPPTGDQFKTYARRPVGLTGAWQTSNMTRRVVAPVIGVTPQYIADYYYAKVSGISNAFVDYYVSATDARGNTYKSPIQHVWVGAGSGGGGSGGSVVTVAPDPPVTGNSVTIQYVATGRVLAGASQVYLHLGWNNWNPVVSPDTAMTFNSASNWWQYTVTVSATATNLDCCLQQRFRHLGQQQRRELEFYSCYEQHAAAAGPTAEPHRDTRADEPDQPELVGGGGRDRLPGEP